MKSFRFIRWQICLLSLFFHGVANADSAPLTSIRVHPSHRSVAKNNRQQLAVTAHFADGATKDVTRIARYTSTDTRNAGVNQDGLVSTFDRNGTAWIIVRYRNQVARAHVLIPRGKPVGQYQFPHETLVDIHTHRQWRTLGFAPARLCSDAQFIRRATLHLTGLAPSPREIRSFTKDDHPSKRARLIDKLLSSPDHHTYFANLWADALRLPRVTDGKKHYETIAFYNWLRDGIARDQPLDRFAEQLLQAAGTVADSPAVMWYVNVRKPELVVEDVGHLFMGMRLRCARCHAHPDYGWRGNGLRGMAAFFAPLHYKQIAIRGPLRDSFPQYQQKIWQVKRELNHFHDRPPANEAALPSFPDGVPLQFSFQDDPRRLLTEWLLDSDEPVFARAVVNRYWAHFFGKGLIDPPNDICPSNPPSNPDLLDALTKDFIAHHYSRKHLLTTICKSRTYQLSAEVSAENALDDKHYSRFYPQPMSPPIVFRVVCQLTKNEVTMQNAPKEITTLTGVSLSYPEEFRGHWLPPVPSGDENGQCERDGHSSFSEQSATQILALPILEAKLAKARDWAKKLTANRNAERDNVAEVFLWTIGTEPTNPQMQGALQFISAAGVNKSAAYTQLITTLMRTRDFLLIR